jgi:hypothetical protein
MIFCVASCDEIDNLLHMLDVYQLIIEGMCWLSISWKYEVLFGLQN